MNGNPNNVNIAPPNNILPIDGLLLLELAADDINVQWSYDELVSVFYGHLVFGHNYLFLLDDPTLEGYLHFRELATLEDLMGNLSAHAAAHHAVPVWGEMHYVLTHGGGNNGFPAFPFAPFNGDA